jgi:hypothetical protein
VQEALQLTDGALLFIEHATGLPDFLRHIVAVARVGPQADGDVNILR